MVENECLISNKNIFVKLTFDVPFLLQIIKETSILLSFRYSYNPTITTSILVTSSLQETDHL